MMWDIGNGRDDQQREHHSGHIAMPVPSMPVPGERPTSFADPFSALGMPASAPSQYPPPPMRIPSANPSYSSFQAYPEPFSNLPRSPDRLTASGYYIQQSSNHHHRHHHKSSTRPHSSLGHHKHSHSQPQVVLAAPQPPIQTQYQQPPRPPPKQQYQLPPRQQYQPVTQQPPQSQLSRFQYSTCKGKKRALCIGINYTGQPHALRGCINDAKNVQQNLIANHGFRKSQIMMLTDDSPDAGHLPTRNNIINAMHWLVSGAHKSDSLFFHYSGHGGQTPDLDGDETDGWDEVIYPMDFKSRGHIIDDEMHDIMVRPLPTGCRLTAIFDSCHSGTVLDLPYIYSSSGRLKGRHVSSKSRARKGTPADVISWSGCKDGQTSADTFKDGVAVGAMSHAFMSSLRDNPNQSYQELLMSVRRILYQNYSQKPQLGSSHHIDVTLRFVI